MASLLSPILDLIASMCALPYMLAFYAVWIIASLFRPFVVFSTVAFFSNPSAALRKIQLLIDTVKYLTLCSEKKWKKTPDPYVIFEKYSEKPELIEQKTIIFLRHGESSWNDTFNKGDRKLLNFVKGFIPGLIKAVATEWYFAVAGKLNESWFYDAPLSDKGRRQAEGVRKYLQSPDEFMLPKEQEYLATLKGKLDKKENTINSQLVSSPLRRATATMAIGLQDRFAKSLPDDKMLLLPALQEISFNPDALCITPPHAKVLPAWLDPPEVAPIYAKQTDSRLYTGNKPVNGKGIDRLQEFCKLVFTEFASKDAIIAAGHSLWFRSFFRTYLPHSSTHISKTKKLINGGLVCFTLQRLKDPDSGLYEYMIDPTSITVLHGGF